jgi:hypothetical protein
MVEKIRERIDEDCHRTIHELADNAGMSYGVCEGDFNRKFEHAPHYSEVCSPTLGK